MHREDQSRCTRPIRAQKAALLVHMYMNISPPGSERAWLLLSKQQDLSPMAVSGVHGRGDVKNMVNKIRGGGTRELQREVIVIPEIDSKKTLN